MKIIFSRKGSDSTAGGFPSLIFPDNQLFSIPIPSNPSHCDYSRLTFKYEDEPIQNILNQVTKNKIRNGSRYECDYAQAVQGCHHDPMVIKETDRFSLGQTGRTESHLRNQEISSDDIFIFYGWFKRIALVDGHWMYDHNERDIHLIWSWMTVDEVIKLDSSDQVYSALKKFPELHVHPHLAPGWSSIPNSIYLSKKHSLPRFSEIRCLTDMKSYDGRSRWRLPVCFNQPQAFTYLKSFSPENNDVIMSYRGYGQEFVLDLDKVSSVGDRQKILQYIDNIRNPLACQ
ncbi:MAG: hypothetical protein PHG00_16820 [Methylococcales bacterium]|nr:hypothetical protein [Methylococcales bacterium]